MKAKLSSERPQHCYFSLKLCIPLVVLSFFVLISTGCGINGNTQNSQGPTLSGDTNVTVLLSSTANDQLSEFGLTFNSVSLTEKSGKTITLLSNAQNAEFIHLNGTAEPVVSVSIPQGIYTSATADIGYSYFTCITLIPPTGTPPGGLLTAIFAYGYTPSSHVTFTLPSPITVTGRNMGLMFNMNVSQSASFASCYSPAGATPTYSINPTFEVTPVSFAEETGLNGEISAVNSSERTFTMLLVDGQTLSVNVNNNTSYQGIADVTALLPGMLVTADADFQSDGSHLARRIAVQDTSTSNISNLIGPAIQTNPSGPTGSGPSAYALGVQQQGFFSVNREAAIWMPYNLSAASFQISNAVGNLSSLPFVPGFSSSNMVPGQNVYVTTESTNISGPGYIPAATVTLVPQTINGTVIGSQQVGSFVDYTVSLASYDLFPTLAVQQGQTTLLNNPSQVEVYVDNSTQQLNTPALALGNTLRFYGLVFNDNGTLRMDCAEVNDGVNPSLQTNSASLQTTGPVRTVRYPNVGGVQRIIVTTAVK